MLLRLLPSLLLDCCVLLFRIRKQWALQSPVISPVGPVVSSTAQIIEEECLTSKTVEDEDRILIDTKTIKLNMTL